MKSSFRTITLFTMKRVISILIVVFAVSYTNAQMVNISNYIVSTTGLNLSDIKDIQVKAISDNGEYIIGRFPSTGGNQTIFRIRLNENRDGALEYESFDAPQGDARDVANDGAFVYHTGTVSGTETAFFCPGFENKQVMERTRLNLDGNEGSTAGLATCIALASDENGVKIYYVGYNQTFYNLSIDPILVEATKYLLPVGYQYSTQSGTFKGYRTMGTIAKITLEGGQVVSREDYPLGDELWRNARKLESRIYAINASGTGAGEYYGAFAGSFYNWNPVPAIYEKRTNGYKAEIVGEGVVGAINGINAYSEGVGVWFRPNAGKPIRGLATAACFQATDYWTDAFPDVDAVMYDINNEGIAVGTNIKDGACYLRLCASCNTERGPLKDIIISKYPNLALLNLKFISANDISNNNEVVGRFRNANNETFAFVISLGSFSASQNIIEFPENNSVYENKPMKLRSIASIDPTKVEWSIAKVNIKNPNETPKKWYPVSNPDKFFLNPIYEGDSVIYPFGKWKIRATIKNTCTYSDVTVEFFDRGLYYVDSTGKQYKINPGFEGLPPGFINPNSNIGLYVHGWNSKIVHNNKRETAIYEGPLTLFDGYLNKNGKLNMVPFWHKAGYGNFLMYMWTQEADDTGEPKFAGAIATPLEPALRIVKLENEKVVFAQDSISVPTIIPGVFKDPKPISAKDPATNQDVKGGVAINFAKSMDQFMEDFRKLPGAIQRPKIRIVGHSLGSNVAILGAIDMKDSVDRIDSADPYFWGSVETYKPALRMLKERGTAFTTYSSTEMTDILRLAYPGDLVNPFISDKVFELYDTTAFVRIWPNWAGTKVDPVLKTFDLHNAAKWYALNIVTPAEEPFIATENLIPINMEPSTIDLGVYIMVPVVSMNPWPWNAGLYKTIHGKPHSYYKPVFPFKMPYPGSCSTVVKTMQSYRMEQVGGFNTIDPGDDFYRVVKSPNNPSLLNPLGDDENILRNKGFQQEP